MTNPKPQSKAYTIWKSPYVREAEEVLNDPTRRRRSSQEEAHRAALQAEIRDSLARRYQMPNLRGDHPLFEPQDESEAA